MSKFMKIFGTTLIVLVILMCLPVAVPRVFGVQVYNVISGSMEPEIPVNSIVYVKAAQTGEIVEGDVIAFWAGESVVTHRVAAVDTSNWLYTTKGDANDDIDFTPVAHVNVLGKVIFHAPFMGLIASLISSMSAKIMLIVIVALGAVMITLADKLDAPINVKDDGPFSGGVEIKRTPLVKKKRQPVFVLLLGLLLIAGGVGAGVYILGDYNKSVTEYADLNAKHTIQTPEAIETAGWDKMIDVDFDALFELNPEVIGWLYVENTDITYPIMFSGDDDKYLHRNIYGEETKAGSIFLEGQNNPDFSDSNTIVYGHNMRNLSMFGSLKYYKSKDGYLEDGHQYFQIITKDKKYRYEIFSYFDTPADDWVYVVPFYNGPEFSTYIGELKRHSYKPLDAQPTSADRIVTLSTCSVEDMRFVVSGVLVEEK